MCEPCYLEILFYSSRQIVAGHVAAPELSRTERWDPEPQDMWRYQSPPERGSIEALPIREVGTSRKTCGGTRALLNGATGSSTTGHTAARGHTPCFLS
jgi:hypothetical protein